MEKVLQQKFEKIESEKENINPNTQNTKKVCEKLKRPSPGGQAITEIAYEKKIKAYEISKPELKPKQIMKIVKAKTKMCLTPKSSENKSPKNLQSPKPSTRGLHQANLITSEEIDDESEKCVVCKQIEPDKLKSLPYLKFVKWAKCDDCHGWVHLESAQKLNLSRVEGHFSALGVHRKIEYAYRHRLFVFLFLLLFLSIFCFLIMLFFSPSSIFSLFLEISNQVNFKKNISKHFPHI